MQVVDWVKAQIAAKNLKRGDRFYTEGELMEIFGISRQTVRHAVGVLEYENILERRQGVGTFVSGPLAPNGKKTIGVAFGFLDGYVNSAILHGIEEILQKNGYTVQLALSEYEIEAEYRVLCSFLESDVQGIILEPARSRVFNPYGQIFNEIKKRDIPLVFMGSYRDEYAFPYVSMDDVAAGRMATEYLINAGHKRIAGLFISDVMHGVLRYQGYTEALRAAALPYTPWQMLWYTNEDELEIFKAPPRVLKRLEGCTAVVCYNDRLAVHLVDALTTIGFRIPEDISVVGIDNTEMAALCRVPLTTIEHPKADLGRQAAENIIKTIQSPDFDATHLIKPRMIERDSIRAVSE